MHLQASFIRFWEAVVRNYRLLGELVKSLLVYIQGISMIRESICEQFLLLAPVSLASDKRHKVITVDQHIEGMH